MRFNEIPASIGELGTGGIYVLNASQRTQKTKEVLTMLNHCIHKKIPDKHSTTSMTGLKGGPMRAYSAHHPVHSRLHGLTRQRGKHAGGYKGFTFTYPLESFITIQKNVKEEVK
jgi:hypothetical protein